MLSRSGKKAPQIRRPHVWFATAAIAAAGVIAAATPATAADTPPRAVAPQAAASMSSGQRSFAVSYTGSHSSGTISWNYEASSNQNQVVVSGTVYDDVKDGASGVTNIYVELHHSYFTCDDPTDPLTCRGHDDIVGTKQREIGRVSTGVGSSAPVSWSIPGFNDNTMDNLHYYRVWVQDCTVDFSTGGTVKGCSAWG
jgi:hypothetical protein